MSMPEPQTEPRSTVFLRHELPDGSSHIDWLIAPRAKGVEPDDRVLVSWRMTEEAAQALCGSTGDGFEFVVVRMTDHRHRYLDYEGPVSGERGKVARIAIGGVVVVEETLDRFRGLLAIGGVWRVSGVRIGPAPSPADAGPAPLGLWKFSARAAAD